MKITMRFALVSKESYLKKYYSEDQQQHSFCFVIGPEDCFATFGNAKPIE